MDIKCLPEAIEYMCTFYYNCLTNAGICVCRNIPNIHVHEKRPNPDGWRGAELQVTIEGNWTTYRVSAILKLQSAPCRKLCVVMFLC